MKPQKQKKFFVVPIDAIKGKKKKGIQRFDHHRKDSKKIETRR